MHQPLVIDTACRVGMSSLPIDRMQCSLCRRHISGGYNTKCPLVMRDAHSDHVNAIFDLTLNLNLKSLLLYGVVAYFYVAPCVMP